MKTSWTSGLTGQQKEEMTASFAAASTMRARAKEIIEDKIKTAHKEKISKEGYADPNWAYKQADLCGYERAMHEIISLFSN